MLRGAGGPMVMVEREILQDLESNFARILHCMTNSSMLLIRTVRTINEECNRMQAAQRAIYDALQRDSDRPPPR